MCSPACSVAATVPAQRTVFGGREWLKEEVARRCSVWLDVIALPIAGRKGVLYNRIRKQAFKRLVEVDVTRFDEADWVWLQEAIRLEMQWALRIARASLADAPRRAA